MKITNIIPLMLLALIGCKSGGDQDINALKEKRTQLESELAEVNAKIKTIEKSTGKTTTVQQKTAHVQVTPVAVAPFKHFIEVQGKVTSDNNLNITPKTAGELKKIHVVKGQSVKRGQVLATIDISTLVRSRDELKTALDFANNVYEKQKGLWDQKIGSEMQYLQAKNNKESLEGKLATLNEQISHGSVTAPANGVIEEIFPKEGENVAPGMPLIRLVGNGDFKITADVSEAYASLIHEGNEAEVYFPTLNQTIKTTVKVVGDEISATNRTFSIELRLPQNVKGAKANMIAYVKVKDYEAKNAVVVPVSVVQKSPDGTFVFLAKDGKAVKQPVKIGQTFKGLTQVQSGLQPGQQVITAGYLDLMEGQPVKF